MPFLTRFTRTWTSASRWPATAGRPALDREAHGGAARGALVLERADGFPRHVGGIEGLDLARPAAGEVEEASHEARGAERLALDLLDERAARVVARRLVQEQPREPGDAGERRVHLVRHARRERPERVQALAVGERLLEPRRFRRVDEDEDARARARGQRPGTARRRRSGRACRSRGRPRGARAAAGPTDPAGGSRMRGSRGARRPRARRAPRTRG